MGAEIDAKQQQPCSLSPKFPHVPVQVGAGSVVVSDIPEHCVAVGVPARIIKCSLKAEPVREMDQCQDFILVSLCPGPRP